MRAYLMVLVAAGCCYEGRAETQFLVANVTETQQYVEAQCINNDFTDAITWITPLEKQFQPRTVNNKREVPFNWHLFNGWVAEEPTYKALFGPITDYTWESIPIIMTEKSDSWREFKFVKIGEFRILSQFQLNFSFMGNANAQIYLCKYKNVKHSPCYIFVLGGWDGNKSILRGCNKMSPIKYSSNMTECNDLIERVNHDKNIFSTTSWSQISIKYSNKQLSVTVNEELLFTYQTEKDVFNDYTTVNIHSFKENALWKYHDYKYYESRFPSRDTISSGWFSADSSQLCISFMANFKESITLVLHASNNKIVNTETFQSDANSKWNHKIFTSQLQFFGQYYLTINYDATDIVSIRNIVILDNCDGHYSALSFYANQKVKCSSLQNPQKSLNLKTVNVSESICEQDESAICKTCATFFKTAECSQKMICDNDACYCSKGYTGSYCEKECDQGTFGYNCAHKCGKCKYGATCDSISGMCTDGCQPNYIPPDCQEAEYPVLIDIASIESNCIQSCQVQLYEDNLNFTGKQQPVYYYTILQKPNGHIKTGQIKSLTEKTILFDDLIKNARYVYEIVLCISEELDECYTESITTFEFQTTCQDLQNDQILIENINNLTNITIESFDPNKQCNIQEHYYLIYDQSNRTVYQTYLSASNPIYNLNVFTEYRLVINRNGVATHNILFQTDEAVPNAVDTLQTNSSTATELVLTWQEPTPIVGIITQYLIEYTASLPWIDKRGCSTRNKEQSTTFSKTIINTTLTLSDLQPFSTYKVAIYASTKKGQGKAYEYAMTTQADNAIVSELYTYQIILQGNNVIVQLSIDCYNWNGPVNISVTATCHSEWCSNNITNFVKQLKYKYLSFPLNQLNAFTNYTLEIGIYKLNPESLIILGSDNISTLPKAPHQVINLDVYSISKTSLFLRWSPPFPPTGVLENFKITYYYYYIRNWREPIITYALKKCKIWENMFCVTLNNLYEDYQYKIVVSGKNQKTQYGNEIEIYETVTIKRPDPPVNLQAIWSDAKELVLEWYHPNKTNGPFKYFSGTINDLKFDHKATINLTYTYKTAFKCSSQNHEATVNIRTLNSKFESTTLTQSYSCPVFKPLLTAVPKITEMNKNNLTIYIPSIIDTEEKSNLYIIVLTNNANKEDDCKGADGVTLNSLIPKHEKYEFQLCWILDNHSVNQYNNLKEQNLAVNFAQMPLFDFKTDDYIPGILLVNEYSSKTEHTWYELSRNMSSNAVEHSRRSDTSEFNYLWLLLICAILILIVSAGFILYRQPACVTKIMFSPTPGIQIDESKPDLIPLTNPMQVQTLSEPGLAVGTPIATPAIKPPIAAKPITKQLAIADLNEYVKEACLNGELERQHEKFKRGLLKPHECGKLPMNYPKNRYKNLIAYDHTRVKLKCNNGIPATDYINANYIKSPICEHAYIATQGPTDGTLYDFWHMILNEGVQYIIILANLIETGKQKVSAYWPDFKKLNKILTFEDIIIEAISEKAFYNFVCRTFKVTRGTDEFEITQLHFTNWPDHGVPLYPSSLLPFVESILEIEHSEKHPILVHCSAGVGRTGTILLIDICLRQAKLTQHLCPFNEYGQLREQRANLVDNLDQYKLVHLVLLEYFSPHKTTYLCEEFEQVYEKVEDSELIHLLQYIDNSAWQELALSNHPKSLLKIEPLKNRDQDIVPGQYGFIYLRPRPEVETRYINAVTVDGFNVPKRFVCTQHPLENSIDDFWRLVVDEDVKVVISLQPEYDVDFWKNGGDFTTSEQTLCEHFEIVENVDFTVHSLDITLKNCPKVDITMIEVKEWRVGETVPTNLSALISVWRHVNNMKLKDVKILVMCRNGANSCGLYIAMTNLLDRMEGEQVVDVCMAVRLIRRSRQQFVNNVEQMRALYRLAALHLSEFDIYSNFTPTVVHAART